MVRLIDQTNWSYGIAIQCTPHGGPVPLAVGLPGVAKTAWHDALATLNGRTFVQMILRQMLPEDIKGVPVPSDIAFPDAVSQRGVVYLLGEDMLRAKVERCIVLLDEFNAGHDVMGAAQEWINNPPRNSWVGAAMNPIESSTAGVELSPAVINRMCQLEWEEPSAAVEAGWRNGFRDYPSPVIPLVPDDFLDQTGAFYGELLCDFRQSAPDCFGPEAYPKDVNQACNPWPSTRSWTHVGILLAACHAVGGNASTKAGLVQGCVGDGAATQFMRFMSNRDMPDFEDLVRNPSDLRLPTRYDHARAILLGCIGVAAGSRDPDTWESCYSLLEVAFGQQQETTISVEGELWKNKPGDYAPRDRNGAAAEMRKLRLGVMA